METGKAGSTPATKPNVINTKIFEAKRAWQALRRACADYDANQTFENLIRAKAMQRLASQLMAEVR